MAEVVQWCGNLTNKDELVIIYVTDCDGDNCTNMAMYVPSFKYI